MSITWGDIKLAVLQKMFASNGTTINSDSSTTEYINNNGPSDDALETHLKELKKQEKSEKIKESLVLLALLLLILIVVYGAIESFSRLM